MSKEIVAQGQRYWCNDCYLQQVQCSCGKIFEDGTVNDAKEKFNKHNCEE